MRSFILTHRSKIIIISIVSFILVLLSLFLLFIIKPNISLSGEKEILIKLHDKYKDPGYKMKYCKIGCSIEVKGKVNTERIGIYIIKYKAKRWFFTTTKIRNVNVIDDIPPVITLDGNTEVVLCPNQEYKEEGYLATDNYDGDITNKVKIKKEDNITYSITDSSGNKRKIVRKIKKVDDIPPVITLMGNNDITLTVGSKYYDNGYFVSDNCDGEIGKKIKREESVDYNKVGVYYIIYSATDEYGNTSSVKRIIRITNTPAPKDGTIYLTFDDGPSELTSSVLNILSEEGVKATFFVINRADSYNNIMQRVVNEGHTLALHSYTHSYSTVYASVDAFFNDLDLISDKVYRVTGVRSKIIRFAGGSSNTASSFNPGIMTVLTQEAINRGYHYFDWNVGSTDTTGISSSQIYNKVISQIKGNGTFVVLMHDYSGNWNTVYALRDIIIWGKNNGYKFSNITDNTSQIHHRVNN